MDAPEYFRIRLEHTLQHTPQSTNLIYLVNGGILALVYFIVKLPTWPYQRPVLGLVIIGLALVNVIHAAFIWRQGKWYSNIDASLATSIHGRPRIKRPRGPRTHTLYAINQTIILVHYSE